MKRSAIILASLLVVFWLYWTLLVPVIEPPVRARTQTAPAIADATPAVVRYHDTLEHLFAENAWERQSPKVLRSGNTLLLFQDYQPVEDGKKIRIFPCTVILQPDGRPSSPETIASTLVLQAPGGAELRLNRPIDLRMAQLGQPVEGRLIGRIEIRSPGRADGSGRLHIVTSNVQINERRLWAPNDVEFHYEQSFASGRDLMIKLMPVEPSSGLDRSKGWAGLRSIDLVQLRRLHLEVADGSSAADTALEREGQPHEVSGEQATPVDITCSGPLRVDFLENLMTLEQQVVLQRTNVNGTRDTLQCERLSLYLHRPPASAQPKRHVVSKPVDGRTMLADSSSSSPPNPLVDVPRLELQRVVAEGAPVVLRSGERQVEVRASKLLYNLHLGRFTLWADPADEANRVEMRQQRHAIWARKIDCRLEEAGGFRQINAEGPGRFAGELSKRDPTPIRASWQRMLVLQKQDDGVHHLTIAAAAHVDVGGSNGIDAETIHVWFEPAEESGADRPRGNQPVGAPDIEAASLRPQRVLALGNPDRPAEYAVRLQAPDLEAQTQRLEVEFEHATPAASGASPAARSRGPSRTTAVPASLAGRSSPRDPALSAGLGRPSIRSDSAAAPTRQAIVSGGRMHVVLQVVNSDVTVQGLQIHDRVSIDQVESSRPQRSLFKLEADWVQMTQVDPTPLYAFVAEGRDVRVASDRMQLLTSRLQLDQATNVVSTQRAGEMIVLVDRDAQNRPLSQPREATIVWQRSMKFDGQFAEFVGHVKIEGPDQQMRAELLTAKLNRRLDFANMSRGASLDIQTVESKGNVQLETSEFVDGQLSSFTYLVVPFARVDRQTGELRCGGPGHLVTVRDGFQNSLDLGSGRLTATPVAARMRQDDRLAERTFLKVEFARQIKGNLNRRVVEFEDRVKVIYGPVLSWNETLSDEDPLRKNDVLLTCDRLTISQGALAAPGQANPLDLLAKGNAYVEGQTFTARGERISYDRSKGQLVLEGSGNADAVISHQARIGGPREEMAARKIQYWPAEERVIVENGRETNLSNLNF